ncbi:piggyBac transposable element-derived protein 3-like [Chrysoperla carnea]|uniref:piggyBac transposable element-derived protein 3-like n=1 Tax=Chrysoperla carnea TaxID=189513 RepID=UPI001D08C180|nr:piggyBac transposable element-derived protein 3-like [Chrysoperla carnea]
MEPLKRRYKKALTASKIADYLQDIEDSSNEDINDIDVVILPPDEVDEMTDIEEGPDDDMGVLPVSDVAGQVEFSCTVDNIEEGEPNQRTSRASKTVAWRKCKPVHSDNQPVSTTANQYLENMITELEGKSAVEIFENLLCDEILEYIVQETETYAKHYKNDLNFSLNVNELKVFLAILFFSSYHHLPQSKLYWCRGNDVHVPFIEKAMSRNRFDKIKSYLHFNDNSKIDNTDKAFKIRPFIAKANESFQKFGIFESNLAVDEMIVKYFGHHGIKQFIKGKPVRFGYKLWALCGVSGFCYNFSLYAGKKTQTADGTGDGLDSRVRQEMVLASSNSYSRHVSSKFVDYLQPGQ